MFRPVYSRMNSSNVGSVKSSTYPPAIPRTCSRTRLSENVRSDTKIPPLEFDRDILSFRLWLGERYGPGGREDSRQNTTRAFLVMKRRQGAMLVSRLFPLHRHREASERLDPRFLFLLLPPIG